MENWTSRMEMEFNKVYKEKHPQRRSLKERLQTLQEAKYRDGFPKPSTKSISEGDSDAIG